ncbi:hypothetical protein D1007_43087 [Hordeum vulgare]|nr:hypothetical protein D1007_43087 [Hordeum vulgare]
MSVCMGRCARCGNRKMRAAKDRLAPDMTEVVAIDATVHTATKEEVFGARIIKNRQRRKMRALAREKNWAIRAIVGLPPKEEKEDGDASLNCDET